MTLLEHQTATGPARGGSARRCVYRTGDHRRDRNTAPIVDLGRLAANLDRAASYATSHGIALRPM